MPYHHRLRRKFEGHASRWTMPRETILKLLSRSAQHMSAKEIYASLHKSYPGMGLSTVYRTLDLLARMGIVTKLALGDGQSRYEFKSSEKEEHHHHLICSECGTVTDFTNCDLSELEQRLSHETGFTIGNHLLEFVGQCQNCQKITNLESVSKSPSAHSKDITR